MVTLSLSCFVRRADPAWGLAGIRPATQLMTACYATAAETANPSHISGAPFNGSLWGGSAGSAGFYFSGLVQNFSGRFCFGGRDMNAVLVALGAGGRWSP